MSESVDRTPMPHVSDITPFEEFPSQSFDPEDWVEGFTRKRLKLYVDRFGKRIRYNWNFDSIMTLVEKLHRSNFTVGGALGCHFKQVVKTINDHQLVRRVGKE